MPLPRFLVSDLEPLVAGKDPEDFVFTTPAGGVLRGRNFRRNTLDLYGHLFPDRLQDLADRVDAAVDATEALGDELTDPGDPTGHPTARTRDHALPLPARTFVIQNETFAFLG